MVQTYINKQQHLCHSFQLFEDSAAILQHWSVSDTTINEVMRHAKVMSMEVYGSPSHEVRQGIIDSVGEELVVFNEELIGFYK